MRAETLMVLLNFTPKKIKRNHPFWEKIIKMGINIEQENIKFKEWGEKFEYYRNNWRFHKNIITDFYSYLRLNFPDAIPFYLFFSCGEHGYGNAEYNEYREDEFYDFVEEEGHFGDKQLEELQFDETIHSFDYNNDDSSYDDEYYYRESNAEKIMVNLADKWLKDILDGESFYEKNKDYFTKTEVKHFLTCDWLKPNIKIVNQYSYMDLIEYYWKVKIRTNKIDLPLNYFVERFTAALDNQGNIQVFLNFFKFICINKRHIRDNNEVYNVSDFVFSYRFNINFTNITWQQLRHMSNEWHELVDLGYSSKTIKGMKDKAWKKTTIKDFTYTIDHDTWIITEITTGKLLYEEGKAMHNCVFSYIDSCASRKCAIFSVKNNGKRMATLEIGWFYPEFRLVQAQGGMNTPIEDKVMKIIRIWANENNIKLTNNIEQ